MQNERLVIDDTNNNKNNNPLLDVATLALMDVAKGKGGREEKQFSTAIDGERLFPPSVASVRAAASPLIWMSACHCLVIVVRKIK